MGARSAGLRSVKARWTRGVLALLVVGAVAGCAVDAETGGGAGGPPGPSSVTRSTDADGATLAATVGSGATGAAGAFQPAALLGSRPAGAAVPFGLAADPVERSALEAEAGRPAGVVRVFARWDTPFPSPDQQALLDAGRVLHLSVRPRTEAGVDIAWSDLANVEPGSPLHQELVGWTSTVAAYGDRVYFTLNHEPETSASEGHGTPADYRAAWRRTVAQLRADGGAEVRTVLVLGRGAYADGTAADWYPGDDVVDVVGVDAYNWYDCQDGPVRPWIDPASLLAPAVAFAADHGKPLAVPEIAATEDPADPLAKARWIVDLARTLASPELAGRIEFAAWFSVDDRNWPRCQWHHDSSPASRQALVAALAWLNHPA